MAEQQQADRSALLGELKIDRGAPAARRSRPIVWFLAIAAAGGIAFVAWAFGRQYLPSDAPQVDTLVVRASTAAAGSSVLDATGYVVARRQATVSAKTTGKVERVLIEEGMTVAAGDLLAVLDSSIPQAQLALSEARLEASKAFLAGIGVDIRRAELDLRRTAQLADEHMASAAERDSAELSLEALQANRMRMERDIAVAEKSLALQRRQLEDTEIRAPFGGVVIAKAAQPGEMISPVSGGGGYTRTGICTIVDMDSLEVEVDVNEAYINRVSPRQGVTVTLNAYPDLRIPAEVIATIPAADRGKATVRVRIGFLERDPRILPDMGVKVAFLEDAGDAEGADAARVIETAQSRIEVPLAALADGHVWVAEPVPGADDGRAVLERRAVSAGEASGTQVPILEGLRAGERIVARASAVPELRDGAVVRTR